MPPAPAAHRRRRKPPVDGAHRTNSPTSHRRLPDPNHFLAIRPFSLHFALTTASHRPRKRRSGGASHPAPCPRRRISSVVFPRHFLPLRPFVLRYVLASGASAPCRRRKASLIDMGGSLSKKNTGGSLSKKNTGGYVSRLLGRSTNDGGLREYNRYVEGWLEVGDLSANQVQLDKANAARRGTGDASNIRLEEVPSSEPEEDLSELFTPLTDDEESVVNSYLYDSGHSKQIVVLHEPSNIEITTEKLGCLRPRGWLNDEVINFYLELLKERAKREPTRFLKCHFFNTFFYKKLAGGKTGYDYQSVRRWTSVNKLGYMLVECDKIFIPIHRGSHWCLAVINMKEETYQYLDSFGVMDHNVLRILARYIRDEVKDKSNIELDFSSWREVSGPLPLQHNGWDCGMFMLKFIDFYSRGLRLSFCQEDMEYFRKRTAMEILRLKAE